MLHLSWFCDWLLSTEYGGHDVHWQLLPLLQSPVMWTNHAERGPKATQNEAWPTCIPAVSSLPAAPS